MVLVIHRSDAMAHSAADMFRYMDILACGTRPNKALSEICTRYRAVLLLYPEELADMNDYLDRLRLYGGNIPCFAVSDDAGVLADTFHFLRVFPTGTMSSTVAAEMVRCLCEKGYPPIGDYRLCGIDASYSLFGCYYQHKPILLTATEARILRFLIRAYPDCVRPADMLAYVFSPNKLPDPSTVRTHICAINRKFREAAKDTRIIEQLPHLGYRITAPLREEDAGLVCI